MPMQHADQPAPMPAVTPASLWKHCRKANEGAGYTCHAPKATSWEGQWTGIVQNQVRHQFGEQICLAGLGFQQPWMSH
eukprot:503198-Amphidinium_carterae.2